MRFWRPDHLLGGLLLSFTVQAYEWVELTPCGLKLPPPEAKVEGLVMEVPSGPAPNYGKFYVRKDQIVSVLEVKNRPGQKVDCVAIHILGDRALIVGTSDEILKLLK